MRVLIGCECYGRVRDAFLKRGHDAVSCDLLPTKVAGPHIQDDVLKHLDEEWDLAIFHPPCTHLAVSGARWFKYKQEEQEEALNFVRQLLDAPIPKIALENPVSIISTKIRKPDQVIRPFMFGEDSTKGICLWLKNLPKLKPTNIIIPTRHTTKSGRSYDTWWFNTCLITDLKKRAEVRGITFQSIADVFAAQWG